SDMEKHQIDEKMWGLFDTSKQDPLGDDFIFWRLTSRLFPDELQSDIISEWWTYFVRVTPSGAAFVEMSSRRPERVWR
ncbi:MAG: hypothetical protein FWC97_06120, partial [Treponema sp.]|nr:hypothetical protein [Treponema sp.]